MSLDPEDFRERVRQDWTDGVAAWRKWNQEMVTQGRGATEAIVRRRAGHECARLGERDRGAGPLVSRRGRRYG